MSQHPICGYSESAFMGDSQDRKSTMGYTFSCMGLLVSWSSKKQRTIALSTTEAEYLVGIEATKEAVWLQQLMCALGVTKGLYLAVAVWRQPRRQCPSKKS